MKAVEKINGRIVSMQVRAVDGPENFGPALKISARPSLLEAWLIHNSNAGVQEWMFERNIRFAQMTIASNDPARHLG